MGYAIKAKPIDNIGIFVSKNIQPFSDIDGFKRQEYRSYSEFLELLEKWINERLYSNPSSYKQTSLSFPKFHEEFLDLNKFIRLWDTPPGCQYNLEFDGLHFTSSHMPIISNHLALLENYSFEFKAKILSSAVGWIVKGSKRYNDLSPQFCLMFNIGEAGDLTPHIFRSDKINPTFHYHPITSLAKNVGGKVARGVYHNIKTMVDGDKIEIQFNGTSVFMHTFGTNSDEKDLYNFDPKNGQIGFRCHPGEEAIIKDVILAIK